MTDMTGKKVVVDGRLVEVLGPRLERRFALNTDRLPEFLAGQEILDDWAPSEEKGQCDFINNLVQAARESGVLAGPGPLFLEAIFDENSQWEFYWEYLVDNAAHGLRPIVPLARACAPTHHEVSGLSSRGGTVYRRRRNSQ